MKPSRIKSIELINYRQFVNQKIDFKLDDNRNVIIIQGKNGFGKSNIYNALTWCFFGIEEHLTKDHTALPICNTTEFNKLRSEESIETSVKIMLETDSGLKEIGRNVRTFKNHDGSYYTDSQKMDFKIFEVIGNNWKPAPYPEFIISRILPKHMRHFFFIDGEKLRQLFENINPEHIKQSIFDLSQITLLQNAIDHLEAFKSSLRRNVKDEPNLERFEEELEKRQNKIESLEKDLEKLKTDRSKALGQKKMLDSEIEKSDYENVKVLETERKNFLAQISQMENQIQVCKHEYLEYLLKISPAIIAKPAIKRALDVISSLEGKSLLPPKMQETFLEELLAKNECICGTCLKDNEDKRKKLEQLMEEVRYSNIADDTTTLKYIWKTALKDGEQFLERAQKYEKEIREYENNYVENQNLLKEINTKIGNIDIEKIKGMHALRERYQSLINESDGRTGKLIQEIKYEKDKFKEIENLYNTELSKKNKYKGTKKRIDLCDTGINQLEQVKNKIMGEIRNETETNTKNYFSKLITEKEFDKLAITENYDLYIEKDGFNAVTSLSAGETLCLGYSFMSALRKASAFLAPIVIDTPLAKIDEGYRINVANWFKDALSDAQVILLVTDTEYTEGFRKAIKSHVSNEFKLEHDKDNKISKVINL